MRRHLFSLLILSFVCRDAIPDYVYRWQDSQGHTHYSDQVPADHARYRREKLNRNGRIVEIQEEAKTADELQRERELKALRNEERRLLAEQRDHDRALLRTFRSVADMESALAGKLTTIDALLNVAQANRTRLNAQLEAQERRAAALDRNGKIIPVKLVEEIRTTQHQITDNEQLIGSYNEEKDRLRNQFERDIRRFRQLTADSGHPAPTMTNARQTDHETIGLLTCITAVQCEKAWTLAKEYVEQNATTELQIDTDSILMTADPRRETDISLTVSRIRNGTSGSRLFLSVRCKQSGLGQELCASPKVRGIRSQFRSFVETGLGSAS